MSIELMMTLWWKQTLFKITKRYSWSLIDLIIKNKKTKMPQGFLVSVILFLIYISKVSNKILETSFSAKSLFFVDDIAFIAWESSVKMLVKTFEKAAQTLFELRMLNVVTYNEAKTEAWIFSKNCISNV